MFVQLFYFIQPLPKKMPRDFLPKKLCLLFNPDKHNIRIFLHSESSLTCNDRYKHLPNSDSIYDQHSIFNVLFLQSVEDRSGALLKPVEMKK